MTGATLGAVLAFLVGGVLGVSLATGLLYYLQQRRHYKDQLLQKYASLIGLLAAEVDRAKMLTSAFSHYEDEDDNNSLVDRLERRQTFHRKLIELGFQIQVLENDLSLRHRVEELTKSQPFLLPSGWDDGNGQRINKYKMEVKEFESLLKSIMDGVLRKQRRLAHEGVEDN